MTKKSTNFKEAKVSSKSLKKNNSARKQKLFSIADVSQNKRGK